MSLTNNTPSIYEQYRKQANLPPSVEDANATDGSLQGKIHTSELTADDGYDIDYSAAIVSVTPAFISGNTGNNYTYEVIITYDIMLETGGTVPGFYGDNIVTAGDLFVITSPNIVRGTINRIISAPPPVITGLTYTYTVTLDCTFTEGDPQSVSSGSTFIWKLNFYSEATSFNNAYPPINLESSYNRATGEGFFYWKNVNELSYSYNLELRELGAFPPVNLQYISVRGNTANPKTSLTPLVDLFGNVATIKINDPGVDCNSERTINFIGPGTGEVWATRLDSQGSLLINEYDDVEVSGIGSISGEYQIVPYGQPISTITAISQATPFGQPIGIFGSTNTPPGPLLDGNYPACVSTSTGNGAGATFNIRVISNVIDDIVLNAAGNSYTLTDALTVSGSLFGGHAGVDDIVLTVDALTPTVYVPVPCTSSGNGVSAAFKVSYNLFGVLDVVVDASGIKYQIGETVTIAAVDVGGAHATPITFLVDSLVPTNYPSIYSSGGSGTGAIFDVDYDAAGIATISVATTGWGYTSGDVLTLSSIDLGGAPATPYFLTVAGYVGVVRVYSKRMRPDYDDYPVPTGASYVSGLPADGAIKHFVVSFVSQVAPGSNRYLELSLRDAETGGGFIFSPGYTVNAATRVQTHDGVYRLSSGTGYNSKLRAEVKRIPNNVKWYYDPAIFNILYTGSSFAWKVSANLDKINKLYTEWTDETQIKI